jgi:hypothetical protein
MQFDLAAVLPQLLPLATEWAQECEAEILRYGHPLDPVGLMLARTVEVQDPRRVRVQHVRAIPWPHDPQLRRAAMATGLLGPGVEGMTLGHGIYIVGRRRAAPACGNPLLLSHECRHVHQYEEAGSIGAFLAEYLRQLAELGYERSPYEVDARAWEREY